MKGSELATLIQEMIEKHGDLQVFSTGYYGDREVMELVLWETSDFEYPTGNVDERVERKWDVFMVLPGSEP